MRAVLALVSDQPCGYPQTGPVGAFGQEEVSLAFRPFASTSPRAGEGAKNTRMFVREDNLAHWFAVFQCICFVGAEFCDEMEDICRNIDFPSRLAEDR